MSVLGHAGLASRWTEAQIEDAARIVNDIAEDMDNPRDTRKKLRQALAIYADLLWDANVALSDKRASETMILAERLSASTHNWTSPTPGTGLL